MAGQGAYSWNSELPSGRNPFWIRDEALAGLGLHIGDAVSVDTQAEPTDGDLVVAELEVDGDSLRTARRYFSIDSVDGRQVRLEALGEGEPIQVKADEVILMGVVVARLRFAENEAATEERLV